ncbi:MAG: HAD-IC family P-type ATPase [Clostridia bacterium]|nr:HAD-IC family P-type ATPase [Clostridia bacterium]
MDRNKTVRDGNPRALKSYISTSSGLSAAQVSERIRNGQDNKAVQSPTKTVREIIFSNVFTYFNLIFFVLAIALAVVGSFNNMTFMGVILVNLLIGIIQEINAKRTLDSLTIMTEPKARVIRDGRIFTVSTDKLVLDDLVVFSSGNQICADAVVTDGEIQVNEALVTGESDEITKGPGTKLLSGSFVVSGECTAKLTAVGENSFVNKLTLGAKKAKSKKKQGMVLALSRLIMVIGITIIPIGTALFIRQFNALPIKENVETTTAALIGMIPEGLYLLVNVTLAVSVIKLARKDTLVHDLSCVETLARVDMLCVDKTGTITDNSMLVSDILNVTSEDAVPLLRDFVYNMTADNITMTTLKKHFGETVARPALEVVPFSSSTKMSSVSFGPSENYILGAPEFVLRGQYQNFRQIIEPHVMDGKRVLVFASSPSIRLDDTSKVRPLALVLLTNPIRPEARETFSYFEEQGVNIKVISGDNPLTVAAAARAAGIKGAERCVDLTSLSVDEVAASAEEYTVFGRVTPEQKKILVNSLKKAGHTVAMTGDGVNDVLALKEADCSIAMASGSDVACQVSHLVLLKSQFSSLPSVVAEGRQVINNIQRSASLFLVKNIFSFLLAIISIFASFSYPLKPAQISLVSVLTIGIPSFILALEKNEARVKGKFLPNVIYNALPAALSDLIVVLGVILFAIAFNMNPKVSSTVSTLLMALVGYTMVVKMCRPFNKIRIALVVSLVLLFFIGILVLPGFFEITAPDFGGYLVLGVFTLLIPSVIFSLSHAITAARNWIYKMISERNSDNAKANKV